MFYCWECKKWFPANEFIDKFPCCDSCGDELVIIEMSEKQYDRITNCLRSKHE